MRELETRTEIALRVFGSVLAGGVMWLPPTIRRTVYRLISLKVAIWGDGGFTAEGDLDAKRLPSVAGEIERYAEELRKIDERVANGGRSPAEAIDFM